MNAVEKKTHEENTMDCQINCMDNKFYEWGFELRPLTIELEHL